MIQRQEGSAITEFVAALFTLVPVFTLFALVGKFSDIEHAAQSGAKYQAWEVALAGTEQSDDLKGEMHKRVFREKSFIQSADKGADATVYPDRSLWMVDDAESGNTRVEMVSFGEDGYSNNLHNGSAGLDHYALHAEVLGFDFGIEDIDKDGLYDSTVNLSLNDVPRLGFTGQSVCANGGQDSYLACLKRNNAILVDDWSSVSPGMVEDRVRELIPALEPWELLADGIDAVLDPDPGIPLRIQGSQDAYKPFDDVKEIDKAPGYVVPDLVPQRNLGSYEDEGIEDSP